MDNSEYKYSQWMVTILSDQKKEEAYRLPLESEVEMVFNEVASEWVFQREKHTKAKLDNTFHYQCAVRTKIRTRKGTLINTLQAALEHQACYITVDRVRGTFEQARLYCSKEDTRIGNVYLSSSLRNAYANEDIKFLLDKEKRFPWQNVIIHEIFNTFPSALKSPDDRTIYWIEDTVGNSGKSKFTKFMCVYNTNISKVTFGNAAQIRSACIAEGPRQLYVVDIPKTLGSDDSINSVISSLEDLKNGFVKSSFYGKSAQLIMNPPHIVVFSNMKCPVDKMSTDRWLHFKILNKELYYFNPDGTISKVNS